MTADTLAVATGSTYTFTMNTPEDLGLVSTQLTAEQLPFQGRATVGYAQIYRILDQQNTERSAQGVLRDEHKGHADPPRKVKQELASKEKSCHHLKTAA